MPITLGPVSGTDRVASSASITPPSTWSAYGWFRRGSGTSGQFISVSASAIEHIGVYFSSSTTDRLNVDRRTTATAGSWGLTSANWGFTLSASKWMFVAVTMSGTSAPTMYSACPADGVALASRTVTTISTPSGTATSSAGQSFWYGNWTNLDYALAGDMAWWGFHNVVLTLGEIMEAMLRGITLRGLVQHSPLEDSTHLYDLSGSGTTLTGTGVADLTGTGPTVVPLWINPAFVLQQEAAAAAAASSQSLMLMGVGS